MTRIDLMSKSILLLNLAFSNLEFITRTLLTICFNSCICTFLLLYGCTLWDSWGACINSGTYCLSQEEFVAIIPSSSLDSLLIASCVIARRDDSGNSNFEVSFTVWTNIARLCKLNCKCLLGSIVYLRNLSASSTSPHVDLNSLAIIHSNIPLPVVVATGNRNHRFS